MLSRLPFKEDFWRWADWGAALMALHIGFASADPWPLEVVEKALAPALAGGAVSKAVLKADHAKGTKTIDSRTHLSGVPLEAW